MKTPSQGEEGHDAAGEDRLGATHPKVVGKGRKQKSKTVPESILEMFYLLFSTNQTGRCVCCVKSYLVSVYVSPLAQSRSVSLHYLQKLSTCKKETMKEAKTIPQARQPPSWGSPTSITFFSTSLDWVLGRENKEIHSFSS